METVYLAEFDACMNSVGEINTSKPTVRLYHIWTEGYLATGGSGAAILLGSVEANSFEEACHKVIKARNMDDSNYNREKLTYWGCKLFDNEIDARKNFG